MTLLRSILILLLLCGVADAQPPQVVRVVCDDGSAGTGAYVATNGETGVVVTNWHILRDTGGRGRIRCTFPRLGTIVGKLLLAHRGNDLACIIIDAPEGIEPYPIGSAPSVGQTVTLHGYGTNGETQGRVTRILSIEGAGPDATLNISATSKGGDSGGPVLNASGEVVAVRWGYNGQTWATSSVQLTKLLQQCYPVVVRPSPRPSQPTVPVSNPNVVAQITNVANVNNEQDQLIASLHARIESLHARIETLEQRQPERGPQGEPGPPGETPTIDYERIVAEVLAQLPSEEHSFYLTRRRNGVEIVSPVKVTSRPGNSGDLINLDALFPELTEER